MKSSLPSTFFLFYFVALASQAYAAQPGLPPNPVRDPNTPGYVKATRIGLDAEELATLNTALKNLLANNNPALKAIFQQHPEFIPFAPRSENPPVNAEGNFIIGPDYIRAPEYTAQPGVPQGKVYQFTMNSTDSKIYPGIDRDPNTYGTADPNNIYTLLVPTSHPAPYTRQVTVYVPSQYVPGTAAPLLVTADGPDNSLPTVLDNLIAERRVPAMIAVMIAHGGRPNSDPGGGSDAQGSERGLEYDTMSGLYAEFVESEVLPLVEKQYNVKITQDPEGRATMGGSSGGAAALTMAWYHPELYHRVLAYSGTFANQQWPFNPATPHGAWGYHETLIPKSAPKPIRLWLEVGDTDNYNRNALRDDMHDWVVANENMVKVLAAKGYHFQFVFALHAGHTDRNVREQTLPEALEWLWKGYVPESAKTSTAMKNFRLQPEQIKRLISAHGYCIATDEITVGGKKVGYMYREKPRDNGGSGWVFTAGDESQEYMDNPNNLAIYDVNTIANYDSEIIPFLDAPIGSKFERKDNKLVIAK